MSVATVELQQLPVHLFMHSLSLTPKEQAGKDETTFTFYRWGDRGLQNLSRYTTCSDFNFGKVTPGGHCTGWPGGWVRNHRLEGRSLGDPGLSRASGYPALPSPRICCFQWDTEPLERNQTWYKSTFSECMYIVCVAFFWTLRVSYVCLSPLPFTLKFPLKRNILYITPTSVNLILHW